MRRFGLIGRPLGHSASAKYFTEKFRKEGLSDCEYALYELPSVEELPSLLAAMPELCGLNVTIPYKRSVMHLLDRIAPEAQAIGAVNCIRRLRDGTLEGHNTDIAGLRAAFDRLLGGAEPAQALVLGTGAPRRPCNTHWPNAGFLSHWCRATRRKAITLTTTCRAKRSPRAASSSMRRPWGPTPPSGKCRESPMSISRRSIFCSTWFTTRR